MAQLAGTHFCTAHEVLRDGSVALTCSDDVAAWPWLALDPHHPIVVQTINFWASVEAGLAKQSWVDGQWTALTEMEWQCGVPGCGHAHHGLADYYEDGGKQRFRITLFDKAGRLVYRMSGAGVIFRTRNFEGWRAAAKAAAGTARAPFVFAADEAVHAPVADGSFLCAEDPGLALVTPENGLPPGHPYMSGSGDHVNATHLAEAVRQYAAMALGKGAALPSGGEMHFRRYVELGVPFEIEGGGSEAVTFYQNEKPCCEARFDYA